VITAAAFCPHPPRLVPEVAQAATAELADLRAACRQAIRRVAASGAPIVVLGAGERWAFHPANARGSLAGYGVAVEVALGSDKAGPVELPLSLTIGAWLLRDALGPECGAVGYSVTSDAGAGAVIGAPGGGDRFALLVMGDGSARRSTSAPGYLDPRAAGYDAAVAAALTSGAGHRLGAAARDTALGTQLLVAGGPAWAVAAGLLEADVPYDAELLYDGAPFGVGYFVAVWTARG
jgi:hypothetical protein